MNPRDYLIYLSLKFNGDYKMLMEAINKREEIPDFEQPNLKCNAVTVLDDDYPQELKNFYQFPLVLFYYGDLSLIKNINKNLAVVGSRRVSTYGYRKTKEIVSELAKDVNIVSGLAIGTDSIAQKVALNSGGKVIAVLGSGIDYCYPSRNKDLYEELKKNHLVISEYPGLTEPTPDKFPFRNRLIAMFSNTILIPEAKLKSGTSVTAAYGIGYNKNICCIPHLASKESLCNNLIANGAFLVEDAKDVLEVMDIKKEEPLFDL